MAAPTKAEKDEGHKVLARNKKALHDYAIDERMEVGVVLQGSEVKSIRDGRIQLGDAYAEVRDGELWLKQLQVAEYPFAHLRNHDPFRDRKLLAHKEEIRRLIGKTREKGYTLVALSMYLKKGKVKVEIGLARGKREYDKRQTIRAKEEQREAAQAVRRRG
jgi:SsrA-binding protein